MKNLFIIFTLFMLALPATDLHARKKDKPDEKLLGYQFWYHKKSTRIGYSMQSLTPDLGDSRKSTFGIALSTSNSFYLHKQPVAGLMKFAIDLGFSSEYGMFGSPSAATTDDGYDGPKGYTGEGEIPDNEYGSDDTGMDFMNNLGYHMANIGLRVGPSITLNPIDKMRICAYFHFVPSAAAVIENSSVNFSFVPYINYGAEIGYKWIGIGIENQSGSGRFQDMMGTLMNRIEGVQTDNSDAVKTRYRINSLRFYLAFRF